MKTVIDAVNYFFGDKFITGKHEQHHTHICFSRGFYSAYASDVATSDIICTIKLYNKCVDEMSKAEWIKPKTEANPIFTQAMADNNILPRIGMECLILNTNCSNPKYIKGLIKYVGDLMIYAYVENGERCDNVKTLKFKPLPVPIELIDKKAYQFDYNEKKGMEGIYSADSERFYFVCGHVLSSYCKNIKHPT